MAVVLAFRVGILLTPGVIRAYQTVQGPAVANWESTFNWIRERFYDPDATDEELSAAASDHAGYSVVVATYSGTFEVRKVALTWTQADAAVGGDDVRQASLHLVKLSGGSPSASWVAGDFTAVKSAVDTWWGAIKSKWPIGTQYKGFKVYKDGPDIAPPQPPVFTDEVAVAGTNPNNMFPPQVAVTITEKAGTKPHWGRMYLPAPAVNTTAGYGRLNNFDADEIATATETLYEALKTANLPAVVYRRPLPEREKKNGTTLPARAASAWTVEVIQIDDVFDVIRSRRWKTPSYRETRDITQP